MFLPKKEKINFKYLNEGNDFNKFSSSDKYIYFLKDTYGNY